MSVSECCEQTQTTLDQNGQCVAPSCQQMLCNAVNAYNAVLLASTSGQSVIEVQFGEQRVKYSTGKETLSMLSDTIARLHRSCPSAASAAILGIGNARPISVRFGNCGC